MKLASLVAFILLIGALPVYNLAMEEPLQTSIEIISDSDPNWLLLMYMAGDNNLGRDGYEWGNAVKMDLEEMENSMPDTGLQILALADMEGANNTYLYDLEPAPPRGISSPTIPLSDVNPAWDDEVDMSDWRTLRDFLVYSLTNRSADNVMFVLWNHGAGWYSSLSFATGSRAEAPSKGFALDSNSGGAMFLDEFRDAFRAAEVEMGELHMDLIGFDTCSMGMMEVFYQVSPWFDLAIGSEDEQPWYGYNYTFVTVMGGASPYTPSELGSYIVSEFEELYLDPGEYSYASITLIDLIELRDGLTPRLDDLSKDLLERMYQNEVIMNHKFRVVRGRTELLGFENLDLGHFLLNLVESDLHKVIRDDASDALNSYNLTVMDEWHQPDGRNIRATGISMYLPPAGSYRTDYDGDIGFLNLTADTNWDEMIHEFHDPIERVHVDLTVQILDGDGMKDDVLLEVTDPRYGTPLPYARVFMNGTYITETDASGGALFEDLYPGAYLFEVYNGTHVGESSVKILNRAPVVVVSPAVREVYEGLSLVLDASGSFDPDGDRISFKWDLDQTDGLNGSDSNSPWVNVSFPEKGTFVIRLTVNDSDLETFLDISIDVVNAPPKAALTFPVVVDEDQEFVASAAGSWDSWPDQADLLYRFSLDGAVLANWTEETWLGLSIPKSGWHLIEVQVRDPEGETASASGSVHVINRAPVANISGPKEVFEDRSITLSAELSSDTPSDIGSLGYKWFLDGFEGPISENITVTFSFPEQMMHSVDLMVTDDDGYSDTISFSFMVWNIEPSARITHPFGQDIAWEDSPFILWGNETVDSHSDMAKMNYSWDVDDDGTIDHFGPTLVLTWIESGRYKISLIVKDNDGASDSDFLMIDVNNPPPVPLIIGPDVADEDETLVFHLDPSVDTVSDIPTLVFRWYVNGDEMDDRNGSLSFTSKFKGTFLINITVTDDDGAVSSAGIELTVRNPRPRVVIEHVPVEVTEGKTFQADAHRTTDNPSDMESLVFQWYLDDVLLENEAGKEIIIKARGPGTHTLKLRVTDDDGDFTEVDVDFTVKASRSLGDLLDRGFSIFALILLIGFLLSIMIAVFQFTKRIKELPPAESPESVEDVPQNKEQIGESEDHPEDDHEEGEAPPILEEDGSNNDTSHDHEDEMIDGEDLSVIPIPEDLLRPGVVPPPPSIDDAVIPEVDSRMFEQ